MAIALRAVPAVSTYLGNPQREHNQRLLLASEKELKLAASAKRYYPLVECGYNRRLC